MADEMAGNTIVEKTTETASGEDAATTAPLDRSSEEWRRQFGALPSAHQRPRQQMTQPQQPTMPQNPTSPTIPAGAMPTGVLAAIAAQPTAVVTTEPPRNRRMSSFAAAGGALLVLTGMLVYGFWPSRSHNVPGLVNGTTTANASTDAPTDTAQKAPDMTGVAPLSGLSVAPPPPPAAGPLSGIKPPPPPPALRPEPEVVNRSKPGAPAVRIEHATEIPTAHQASASHEVATATTTHLPVSAPKVEKVETPSRPIVSDSTPAKPAASHPASSGGNSISDKYASDPTSILLH